MYIGEPKSIDECKRFANIQNKNIIHSVGWTVVKLNISPGK